MTKTLHILDTSSITLTIMNAAPRSKWLRHVVVMGAVTILGLTGLIGWMNFGDGSRSKALRLFDALTPGMNESEALRLVYSEKNVCVTRIDGAISPRLGGWVCLIDDRITLGFRFDRDKGLAQKFINELEPPPSPIRDWLTRHLARFGISNQTLYRHWP
jgi:hypothetical protein